MVIGSSVQAWIAVQQSEHLVSTVHRISYNSTQNHGESGGGP